MARDLEHDSCFWRNGPARGVLCYGLGISICRTTYCNFKEYGIGRFHKEYVWDGFSFYVSFGNMEGWDLYRLMKFGFGFPATATDRFQHLHYDLENKLGYRVEEISIRKDDPMLCVHRVAFSEDGGEEVPRTLLTD